MACSVSLRPMPWPLAYWSTTTSSIQARTPVGIGNTTSVSEPTIWSAASATSKWQAEESTIVLSASSDGGGLELESWGMRRSKADTSDGVTSVTSMVSTNVPPTGRYSDDSSSASSRSRAAELMQYRRPVGAGPSGKTWPRWPPQLAHLTSVRTMP